uniref:Uncharacterized protein n=1 Tax=Arundo donax TaxID=35708 RepID=A0A0A9CAL7_ARUDO
MLVLIVTRYNKIGYNLVIYLYISLDN